LPRRCINTRHRSPNAEPRRPRRYLSPRGRKRAPNGSRLVLGAVDHPRSRRSASLIFLAELSKKGILPPSADSAECFLQRDPANAHRRHHSGFATDHPLKRTPKPRRVARSGVTIRRRLTPTSWISVGWSVFGTRQVNLATQKCRGAAAKPDRRSGDPACRSGALHRERGRRSQHREDRQTGRRRENQHLSALVDPRSAAWPGNRSLPGSAGLAPLAMRST
jgi:hypothetical protein